MNTRNLLGSVLMLVSVLLSACQTQATPTSAVAPTNADALAGTWSGTAINGDFTYPVNITIEQSCSLGSVCGSFDLPTIPCSGTLALIGISGTTYQVQSGSHQGSCTSEPGTEDFLELLPDGTLLYITRSPSYGESKGVLQIAAPTAVPTAVVSVTPPTAKVIAEWKIIEPSFIAFGFDSVWVTGHYNHTMTRIDPASNEVVAVIEGIGRQPEQALAVGDVLWVTGQYNETTWIDPITNTVINSMPALEGQYLFIAYGFNSLWVTTRNDGLDRIDPATRQVTASIELGDGKPNDCMNDVLTTAAAVWVVSCDKEELIKVDPATNSVVSKTPWLTLIDQAKAQTTVPSGKGADFIWIDIGEEGWGGIPGGLLRIDPNTGTGLTFLPLTLGQSGDGFIAVTDEAVWIGGQRQINRVNVATNQIDATYATDSGRLKIGIGFGSVWLRNFEKNLIQRLDIAP